MGADAVLAGFVAAGGNRNAFSTPWPRTHASRVSDGLVQARFQRASAGRGQQLAARERVDEALVLGARAAVVSERYQKLARESIGAGHLQRDARIIVEPDLDDVRAFRRGERAGIEVLAVACGYRRPPAVRAHVDRAAAITHGRAS